MPLHIYTGVFKHYPTTITDGIYIPGSMIMTEGQLAGLGEEIVANAANHPEIEHAVFINHHIIFDAIRLALAKLHNFESGVVSSAIVTFISDDGEVHIMNLKKNGRLDKWPRGFYDQSETLSAAIVDGVLAKKRKNDAV